MTTATLPFGDAQGRPFKQASGHSHNGDVSSCPVFRMLPQALQAESKEKQHLWDYLHTVPVDEIGVPQYHEALSRSMGDMENPNLIYPVGNGIYVHIYSNASAARHNYVAIEPGMNEDISAIIRQAELRLVDFVSDLDRVADLESRAGVLLRSLDKFCKVQNKPAGSNGRVLGLSRKRGTDKLLLSPEPFDTASSETRRRWAC